MRHFYLISFSIFVCLFSTITQAQQKSANNSLSGTVTDVSGTPLAAASIYIHDLKLGVASDASGRYAINNISSGNHLVEVSYIGYGTVTAYINVEGDTKHDFKLSPSIVERNEVVVTGVSAATQQRRSPVPVTVLRRENLLEGVATNLVDALGRQPGITQIATGPAISKPVIRGLGYNRVVVVNDGVRQEGQQWGDEHGIEVDEYSVSKVEIIKGPASLMYGSDAMAGVIHIITNVPAEENTIRGNIIANYQTNNRLRGTGVNLAGNRNGFNWNAWGSLKAAADYQNAYDGYVYNSKFNERNFGGYIGLNKRWGYSHLLVSNFNQHTGIVEGDRDEDGNFIKPLPGGGEGLPTKDDFTSTDPQIPFQHINHFKVTSDNSFNLSGGRLVVTAAMQRNQRQEYGNIDDPSEKELFFDLRTFNYLAAFHFNERNGWQVSAGVNGMVQQNQNKGAEVLIPEYDLFDIGAFAYVQKRFEKTTLSGGFRFDSRSIKTDFLEEGTDVKFEALEKNFSNITGSIGVSHDLSRQFTVKFNLARGFRTPSIPELASNGAHEGTNRYEYGNSSLKSETSWQADAGLEWNSDHVTLAASLFNNSINNFIFYRSLLAAGGGDSTVDVDGDLIPAFKYDQHKANLAGLELTIDIHPHPLDWLHFENTFSFVRGRFTEAVEGVKDMPLIPPGRLISELKGKFLEQGKWLRNLSAHIEMMSVFKQEHAFTAYDTETPTDGYTLFNSGISADIVNSKRTTLFSIYFSVNNIGDIAYQDHLSRLKYTAENQVTGRTGVFNMGRNFSIKLNVPLFFHLN